MDHLNKQAAEYVDGVMKNEDLKLSNTSMFELYEAYKAGRKAEPEGAGRYMILGIIFGFMFGILICKILVDFFPKFWESFIH